MKVNKENNFNLIRLLAALQVLIYHSIVHFDLKHKMPEFVNWLSTFPGVPIFFTISGFLISQSLERNNFNLKKYFKNRAFRIYPALWVCTIFTCLLLLFFVKQISIKDFGLWLLAQFTFFQFYASPSIKTWGVGHPNGSLWSISVELQFYLTLPIILAIINLVKKNTYKNILLLIFFAISVILKYYVLIQPWFLNNGILAKISGNTVLFNLHFFLTGIILYYNFEAISNFIYQKAIYWLILYLLYYFIFGKFMKYYSVPYEINAWGIIANSILALLVLSFAFTSRKLSGKLLGKNDISYGIYLYHMPIINVMVSLGYKNNISNIFICLALTTILAYFSWKYIEQKVIQMK